MVEFFPYKRRMTQYKNRYTNAYANAIDNVDDWMSSSQQPKEDNLTFNRQHLVDKCINLSGIPYWFPTNGATSALCQAINVLSKPNDKIIIQGDYRDQIMQLLKDKGFTVKRVGG